MKIFQQIKYRVITISLLFLIVPILLNGKGIEHQKIKYNFPTNLSKIIPLEFISEAIAIPIENPEPFIAVGFSAELSKNRNDTKFYIRSSFDKLNWTKWQLITREEDYEQDDLEFISALSFFQKDNKYIQFRTNVISDINNLSFNFISPGKSSKSQSEESKQQSQLNKALDGVERPTFVSRKTWGCPQDEHVSSRSLTDVTHLIIHHSAGNTVSSDYAAVVRSYWDYHVNGHGWDDIGYNWLVDPNGVLYKGRAWQSSTKENVIGAHNTGKNSNTVGICFIGNYMSSIPSEAGLDKLASISAFLCDKYSIDPLAKSYHAAISHINDNITGHGQSGGVYGSHSTACPGTQIITRMQSIREQTYAKIIDISAAPKIVSTYPNAEVDSVYLTKEIFFKFTHPMNKSSVESAFTILPEAQGTISWNTDGSVFFFKPTSPLKKQTNYKIVISKLAKSKWDVALVDSIELSFITKVNDNLKLLSNYPHNGDTDIPNNVTIELHFDGPISGNSLGGNILFLDSNSVQVSISVNQSEYSNGIIKFRPKSPLDGNSTYSLHLKEGIATTDNYSFGLNKIIYFTTTTTTSVSSNNLPTKFKIEQNYPNPFNPSTTIKYSVPSIASQNFVSIQLKIYDILGREVATLVDETKKPGVYEISFNASNLPSGIYYYQLKSENFLETKKMILLK